LHSHVWQCGFSKALALACPETLGRLWFALDRQQRG
jgi:hypothetical protein